MEHVPEEPKGCGPGICVHPVCIVQYAESEIGASETLPPKDPKIRTCHCIIAESLHFGKVAPSAQHHVVAVKVVHVDSLTPLLHHGDAPIACLPGLGHHPPWPALEQSWHLVIKIPEIVDKIRETFEKFRTTHCFDRGK